ncbi:unnamed protein product [Ectocarpus sp. 4 AP-2014]
MAGGGDGSSEEFVEDDSACGEEEEEDGDSSASFESEEDEDDDDDGATGDDSDVFETPIKARKRSRTPSQQPGTAATAAPSSSPGKNKRNTAALAADRSGSSSKKMKVATAASAEKSAAGAKEKGKGKAAGRSNNNKPSPSQGSSSSSPGPGTPAAPGGRDSGSNRKDPQASSCAGTPATPGGRDSGSTRKDPQASSCGDATEKKSSKTTVSAGALPLPKPVGGNTGANGGTAAGKKGTAGAGSSGSAPKTPKAAVSDYMLQSNRPYSYINVFDNLRKKIPKAMVQKLLDELVRDGTLKLQEYGKARIYYANQDALPNGAGDASADKMRTLDQEAKTLTSQLEIVSKQEQQTRARVSSLSCQPTDDELAKKLTNSAQELEQAEARNGAAKGQGRSVAAGGMKAAKQSFNKYVSRGPTLGDGSNGLELRYSALTLTRCGMIMTPPCSTWRTSPCPSPVTMFRLRQVLKQ